MTRNETPLCERVQMAAMAHRDGEHAELTTTEVDAHLAGCPGCRAAVAELATLQQPLTALDYESLDVDMWPGVQQAITSEAAKKQPGLRLVLVLAVVVALWRLAQLSIDLPAPVVNSVVPLVLTVAVLWRVTGDPFAIQVTTHQLEREGV